MHITRRRCSRAVALALTGVTAALALGTASATAFAPSSTPTGSWMVVGGRVNAAARAGDAVYLGGRFTGLARRAPGVAAFDPESGDVDATTAQLDPLPNTDVEVTAITAASDGSVYVAGRFAGAGGVAQPRLLRFLATGALDTAFKPVVADGASINDIELGANNVLYLAGAFTTIGGAARSGGLAAVDGTTGAVKAWQPAVPAGSVTKLVVAAGQVYLGGSFSQIGGDTTRANAAAVTLDSGGLTSWKPAPDGPVNALALRGSSVYLGGSFTTIGGGDRRRLAAVDAASGALRTSWTPPVPDQPVDEIAADDARVFVAGAFVNLGATRRPGVAALSATSGAVLTWDAQASRPPSRIALSGQRVYLSWRGGLLPKLGSVARCGLASVSAETGAPTAWDPSVDDALRGIACSPEPGVGQYQGNVAALTVAGGKVWAGGRFTIANVRQRAGLAAVSADTGEPRAWAPRLAGADSAGADIVHDLLPSPDGSTIYIAGSFLKVNDQSRPNAAAVTASGVLTDWTPAPNGVVRTLAFSPDGALVYLGGDFTKLGAADLPRLAAAGASTAAPTVVESWRPNPNAAVSDLLTDAAGGRLYAAGRFATIGGQARPGLAALDAGTTPKAPPVTPWTPLLATTPGPPAIEALALRGTQVVAGGEYATADGTHANLAAFEIADAATAPWAPAVRGRVDTVAVDATDSTTYVTGRFGSVGEDVARSGAAAFAADGTLTGWDPAPTNDAPASGDVVAVSVGGVVLLGADRLLLTGAFRQLGGRLQGGIAFFGPAQLPTAAGAPSVAGNPQIGQRLTCVPGKWGGGRGTLTIQWLRGGTPITAAAGATYTIVGADGGQALSCRETMSNAAGAPTQTSAAVTVTRLPPELDTAPIVGGQPWAGGSAECATGLWRNNPLNFGFRWFLDDGVQPIGGATGQTYAAGDGDIDHSLACEVTASNEAGAASARSAAVTITVAPPSPGEPRISGDPRVGTRLTCDPGQWDRAGAFAYQWLRDRVPLVDAVDSTYVPTSRDLGKMLTCLVGAANAGGTTSAESAAVIIVASVRSTGTGRRANLADDEPASGDTSLGGLPVDVRSILVRSGKTLAITVRAPGTGSIVVDVTRVSVAKAAAKPTLKPKSKAKAKAKPKTKTILFARGVRKVVRAGNATLLLNLSKASRRLIIRAGRVGLRVTVRASFRPAQGAPASSDRTSATLRIPGAR